MDTECAVTICIPARNAEKFIRYTLENLLQNDFDPQRFEILIGNNGSQDQTAAIVSEFQDKFSNIRMFDIPFKGSNRPRVRNLLAQNAKGKLLVYIDQDILVSRQFINAHAAAHEKYGASIVTGYTFGKCSMDGLKGFQDISTGMLNYHDITKSLAALKENPCFQDGRVSLGYAGSDGAKEVDLKDTIAPFKTFWLCNVSIERELLLRLGGFDETFCEWGLDDDDFAYRVELNHNSMVFSSSAWAYHMVHPVAMQNNLSTWRKNSGYLFSKYKTRELEFFYVYKGRVDSAQTELSLDMDSMPEIPEIAKTAGESGGKRLGILVTNEADARALALTDCFNPTLPLHCSPYITQGCRFWSLLGLHTDFKDREIANTIIIADRAMFLDEAMLKLLLIETSRISQKVTVYFGLDSALEQNSYLCSTFKETLGLIYFDSLEICKQGGVD